MRFNEVALLIVVLLFGILVGAIGTAAIYTRNAEQQAEAQASEDHEALQQAQQELASVRAQINDYQEAERKQQQAIEQPIGTEPATRPAAPQRPVVAAAPQTDIAKTKEKDKDKERDVVPPPHDEGSTPTTTAPPKVRFGPPVTPRPLDDNAADTRQKTAP